MKWEYQGLFGHYESGIWRKDTPDIPGEEFKISWLSLSNPMEIKGTGRTDSEAFQNMLDRIKFYKGILRMLEREIKKQLEEEKEEN